VIYLAQGGWLLGGLGIQAAPGAQAPGRLPIQRNAGKWRRMSARRGWDPL